MSTSRSSVLADSALAAHAPGRQAAYGEHARSYERDTAAFQPYRRAVVEALPLRRGQVVLDVGCGTGLCCGLLREKAGGGKWAAPMMVAMNSMVRMLHAPYASVAQAHRSSTLAGSVPGAYQARVQRKYPGLRSCRLREVGTHGPDAVADRWPGADGWLSLTGIIGE